MIFQMLHDLVRKVKQHPMLQTNTAVMLHSDCLTIQKVGKVVFETNLEVRLSRFVMKLLISGSLSYLSSYPLSNVFIS